MAKVATDNNAMEFRAASLRKRFHASLCMLAGLTIVGIGLAAMLHVSPKANAATTLTIQPNAPATLSAKAGIRLAKVIRNDGRTCYRASRRLPAQNRSISETFCAH